MTDRMDAGAAQGRLVADAGQVTGLHGKKRLPAGMAWREDHMPHAHLIAVVVALVLLVAGFALDHLHAHRTAPRLRGGPSQIVVPGAN